jgi:hypothetical protein
MTHLYAVLVHESPDCILDLLRALREHDPESHILLYNGGTDEQLLSGLPLEDLRVHAHLAPRPMRWSMLHGFALDCMRYALAQLPFQAMTIVDSDQMPLRPGWSAAVGASFAADQRLGLLSSEPTRQYADTKIDPVRTLYAEHIFCRLRKRGGRLDCGLDAPDALDFLFPYDQARGRVYASIASRWPERRSGARSRDAGPRRVGAHAPSRPSGEAAAPRGGVVGHVARGEDALVAPRRPRRAAARCEGREPEASVRAHGLAP